MVFPSGDTGGSTLTLFRETEFLSTPQQRRLWRRPPELRILRMTCYRLLRGGLLSLSTAEVANGLEASHELPMPNAAYGVRGQICRGKRLGANQSNSAR